MNNPTFWTTVRLDDVCELGSGDSAPQRDIYFTNGNVPFVRMQDVGRTGNGMYVTRTTNSVNPHAIQELRLRVWAKNSLLFPKSGASVFLNNRALLLEPSCVVSHLAIIVPGELILPEFLYFYSLTIDAARLVPDTNYPSLRLSDIGSIQIPLPPLQEQHRIVAILRQAYSIRQWRSDANNKAKAVQKALFYEMFGNPITNEKGWKIAKVGDIGDVLLGRQRAPKYHTGQFTRPYVRVANVFEDFLDLSDVLSMDFDENDFQRFKLEDGDILINEGQSTELVGRSAIWHNEIPDCCFQNTLIRYRTDRSRLEPEFAQGLFLIYLQTGEFSKISAKTSNMAHLGASRLASMEMILPPISLQREYAAKVQVAREIRGMQANSLEFTEQLFRSLTIQAFKGDLTASWREKHEEELQRAAVERDKKLGIRGEKPRLIDYEMGRVTSEEAEQFRRAIQPLTNGAIQAVANTYQPILQAFSQNLFKQAVFTNFADEVMKGLPDFTSTFREVVASSTTELNQVTRRSLIDVSSMLEAVTAPLNEAIRQSTENFYLSLANQLSQIALTPPPQPHRAIHEGLDPITSDVLRMAQYASVYFRAEELAEDGISSVQIEASLHLLEALGFVRQVEVDGRLVYRIVDEKAEVVSKPNGLEI